MKSWLSSLSESSSNCCRLFEAVLYDHIFCSAIGVAELMWAMTARLMPQNVAVLRGCLGSVLALCRSPAERLASSLEDLERAEIVSGDSLLELKNGRGVKARLPGVF